MSGPDGSTPAHLSLAKGSPGARGLRLALGWEVAVGHGGDGDEVVASETWRLFFRVWRGIICWKKLEGGG